MKTYLTAIFIFISTAYALSQTRGVTVTSPTGGSDNDNGEKYALIVGISKYSFIKPLNFADKDAELFRDYLLSKAGGSLKPENITFLGNEQATSGNFQTALTKFYRNPAYKKGDRAYFYFAGHGDGIKDLPEYYLLLQDCQPAGDANNYETGLGTVDVVKLKNRLGLMIKQGVEVYLILDACRTNELPGGANAQVFSENVAEKKVGEIMMLATGPGQVSLETPTLGNGHGIFTYKLIDGLSGLADAEEGNNDGKISLAELQDWVRSKVRKTAQALNAQQVPYFCCSERDNTTVATVDSVFQKQWTMAKSSAGKEMVFTGSKLSGTRNVGDLKTDTALIALYNKFSVALQNNKIWGSNSADDYYTRMDSLFPSTPLTNIAKDLLSSGFIGRCQQKINLYLEGKDNGNDITIALKEYAENESRFGFIKENVAKLKEVYQTNFATAAKMLEKTIKLQSYDSSLVEMLNPKIYFFYLKDYYQQEDNTPEKRKEALALCLKAWLADSTGAYISQAIALYYEKNNQYDSALFYIRNAIRLAPNWAYPKNHLGYVFYKQQSYDSAGIYYLAAIKSNPLYMESYFNYGRLADEKPTPAHPNPYFAKFIKLPNGIAPKVFTNYAEIQKWPWKTMSAKWLHEKAALEFAKQKLYGFAAYNYNLANRQQEAINMAIKSIAIEVNGEDDSYARHTLADIYLERGKIDSAIAILENTVKKYPKDGPALWELGVEYFSKGKNNIAIECFKKDIQLEPTKYNGYEYLSYLYKTAHNFDSSLYYSRLGMEKTDNKVLFLVNLANIYSDKNNKDSAKIFLDSAFLQLESSKHSFLGLEDQVIDKFALIEKETFASLFNSKASYYLDRELYDSSIFIAKKGLQYDVSKETQSLLYSKIAYGFLKLGKYDSSIANYAQSAHLDPAQADLYYNLACVYALKGDNNKSLLNIKEAIKRGSKIEEVLADPDLKNLIPTSGFQNLLKKQKHNNK